MEIMNSKQNEKLKQRQDKYQHKPILSQKELQESWKGVRGFQWLQK